jgi:hypothetical protein
VHSVEPCETPLQSESKGEKLLHSIGETLVSDLVTPSLENNQEVTSGTPQVASSSRATSYDRTQKLSESKLSACMRADHNAHIAVRYLHPDIVDLRCLMCDADLSKRTDWEPFLSGVGMRYLEGYDLEQGGVCYACLDTVEVESTTH